MQLKIKKGIELLDTYGDSKISVYNDSICVNFKQRYTYFHLTQKGKTITIYVKDDPTEDNSTLSMIKLVFTGEADKFIFDYFEKDQLSLKRLKFYSFHSENGHKQEDVAHFKAVDDLATYLGNEIVIVPLVRDYRDKEDKGLYVPVDIGVYPVKVYHHTEVIDCMLKCWYDETTNRNTGEFYYGNKSKH